MRPHGRAQIDPRSPRALAICDRCQFMVNHDTLRWQMRWRGPKLQNIRLLVCPECYDTPNEQERTIVLPTDPVTIANARPENYALADNPMSPIGFNPIDMFIPGSSLGQNIGTLTQNGGLDAAFAQAPLNLQSTGTAPFTTVTAPLANKRWEYSAALAISQSSFGNTVGKNWNGDPTGISITLPSTAPAVANIASSFSAYAPNDQSFLRSGATGWLFQGSNDGTSWTTLSSGTTAGTIGETITATFAAPGTAYGYHQLALQGDGVSHIGVAGLVISIANAAPNEI